MIFKNWSSSSVYSVCTQIQTSIGLQQNLFQAIIVNKFKFSNVKKLPINCIVGLVAKRRPRD